MLSASTQTYGHQVKRFANGKLNITFLYLLILICDQSGLKTLNVSNNQMTNEVGRSLFAKAGELGAPVGIMTMKVKDAFLFCIYVQLLLDFGILTARII